MRPSPSLLLEFNTPRYTELQKLPTCLQKETKSYERHSSLKGLIKRWSDECLQLTGPTNADILVSINLGTHYRYTQLTLHSAKFCINLVIILRNILYVQATSLHTHGKYCYLHHMICSREIKLKVLRYKKFNLLYPPNFSQETCTDDTKYSLHLLQITPPPPNIT
jgi:hypothetical protein